jgi:hypothetical protein
MTRTSALTLAVLVLGGLAGAPAEAVADAKGRIRGKVLDQLNAIALPGVAVEVEGQAVVYTDIDGVYEVSVPPGTYQLKVAFSGYTERTLYGITIEAGHTADVDVVLVPSSVKLREELTVTAQADPVASTQAAALLERKRSGTISEGLAGDEMKKNADSDAASALQRVTGVSVVGGQYVFVRGLGERYSNTTLNGAVLPTTEPDKKVVPLDLFPSGLIENVRITKSYLPDKPAEFAGGLLEIQAISFPRGPTFSVSGSLGYNSLTTFEDGQRYPGGGLDWLGYDDGTRALPGNIPDAKLVEGGVFGGGFTREEMTAFGRSFANVWEPRPQQGRPDSSFSVLAGNSWGKLGAVASLAYNHKNRFRAEQQQLRARRGQHGRSPDQRLRPRLLDLPEHRGGGGQPVLPLLGQPPARARELLHEQRPRRGADLLGLPGGQGPRPAQRPPLLDRGDDLDQQALRRALLPRLQPLARGLARLLLARHARRARPAREPLRVQSRDRRVRILERVAERLPDVQRPRRPDLPGRGRLVDLLQRRRGTPDPAQGRRLLPAARA